VLSFKLTNLYIVFTSHDFHPYWHIYRPPPGFAYERPPRPILDPITRQQRRSEEAERRAHARAHDRRRTAESGRILSQFEAQNAPLRHCSACVEPRHDKSRCQGCKSTGHIRSTCPFRGTGTPIMQEQPRIHQSIATSALPASQCERESTQDVYTSMFDNSIIPATQY
jgi:hypothetical protein